MLRRKNIYLPDDADLDTPEWGELQSFDTDEIDRINRLWKPCLWIRKLFCKVFGHRIVTYEGGYYYKAMKGNLWGGHKGREKKPQRYYKQVLKKEGYCSVCGKWFSATYIKKHKIR